MKRVLFAAALCGAGLAQAGAISGFTGSYAVGNWTSSADTGTIAATPASLVLTSGDDGSGNPAYTSFYIQFTKSATVNFSWAYATADTEEPFYDPFGFLLSNDLAGLEDGFSQLTVDDGGLAQFGSYSVAVAAGEYFGFAANTLDNFNGPAITTINGLRIVEVPEPGALALLALALTAAAITTRRRRAG